ncbi:MAG: LPS export ABC transporter periplasmic protein LptC [Gammaproteobacteria bacterium]
MIKTIIITLTFTALIAVTGRHLLTVEADYSSQLQHSPEQQLYTHQFKNFTLTHTNELGIAKSVIHSPSTRSLESDQKTLMDTPKVTMYREQQAPMIITANSAEIFHQKNITVLNENVNVSMPDKRKNNIIMTTEQLTLDNITQSASTDLPATIVHGKGKMTGTGLKFDPHTQQIKFLTKVRGTYEY